MPLDGLARWTEATENASHFPSADQSRLSTPPHQFAPCGHRASGCKRPSEPIVDSPYQPDEASPSESMIVSAPFLACESPTGAIRGSGSAWLDRAPRPLFQNPKNAPTPTAATASADAP